MIRLDIVIPTIGLGPYFDEALGSLLSQAEEFHEIIVYDNSESKAVRSKSRHASHPAVRWEFSPGFLPALQSWNNAVACCTADHVTIFGDDDVALPGFAKGLKDALRLADFAISRFDVINETGQVTSPAAAPRFVTATAAEFRHFRMRQQIGMVVPGVAFRREHFQKLGGFRDTHFPKTLHTDDDLWFRIAQLTGLVAAAPDVIWRYRWHSGQIGSGFALHEFARGVNPFLDDLIASLQALGAQPESIFPPGQTRKSYHTDLLVNRFQMLWKRELEKKPPSWSSRLTLIRTLTRLDVPSKRKIMLIRKAIRSSFRAHTKF
ncbi:MAG: glycosyltransferase family 2 protein [Burkholderiales bacterium]|nr:glycosyltransferase family 2 protein [Opitutaceae bacterium]